jgi:hypothetical protein
MFVLNIFVLCAVGTAESKLKSEWKPNENVAIYDSGEKTDKTFSCACMKNCAIMGNKKSLMCSDGDDTKKVGAESIAMPETIKKKKKDGECVCRCGTKDILQWGVK